MSNEQYLISSYFIAGFASIVLGTLVYILLRNSFNQTLGNLVDSRFSRLVRRFFLYGVIFPAFAGFSSVAYRTCSVDTYAKIIESRSYLIGKNVEQAQHVLLYLVLSLSAWAIIVGVLLVINERKNQSKFC